MTNFHKPTAVITSLFMVLLFTACGALQIKTWYTDKNNVSLECQTEKPLIRRDSAGAIKEARSIVEADGFRCYSRADDEAWRNRMALCCSDNKAAEFGTVVEP